MPAPTQTRPTVAADVLPSTALLTDHYELTMLDTALQDGTAHRRATFELFARSLKDNARFGVFAGLGRFLQALRQFRFDEQTLQFLADRQIVSETTLEFLADWTFTGDIFAYREGDLYMPYSPVLRVEATFAEALLLETVALSMINHDSAVATKAARIVGAADGTPVLELGSRRTHDQAAVAAARATMIAGFAGTSNLEAGRRFGLPTMGTAAHAWTLAHGVGAEAERAAFDAQIARLGADTTLLVDTFDIPTGLRNAVEAANAVGAAGPGAVRIDSGDLGVEAKAARKLLDDLGATETRIVVSGDLDEYKILQLEQDGAPIDAYGVGTRAVAGLTAPGFVYKLVAIADASGQMRPVAKKSSGKATVGGGKRAWRLLDDNGQARAEHVVAVGAGNGAPTGNARELQVQVVKAGEVLPEPTFDEIQRFHENALGELLPLARLQGNTGLSGPALPTHLPDA